MAEDLRIAWELSLCFSKGVVSFGVDFFFFLGADVDDAAVVEVDGDLDFFFFFLLPEEGFFAASARMIFVEKNIEVRMA